MKLRNAAFKDFNRICKDKKLILYGVGQTLEPSLDNLGISDAYNPIEMVVDKQKAGKSIEIAGKNYIILSPDQLRQEKNCVILIVTVKFLYDIYKEMEKMNLDDSVDVMSIALMRSVNYGEFDRGIWNEIINRANFPVIPKVIHTFWFSGDKIPQNYQTCIDTWKKQCPDYEIKIWNLNNYDGNGNKYFEEAIKNKKWPFASDFARFDIIYKYGGIYMDADVFLLKSFDELLGMKAFFGYTNWNSFQSETFGSVAGNALVGKMANLYSDIEYTQNGRFDPVLDGGLYRLLKRENLPLHGNLNIYNEMALLPWNILSVLDNYVFRMYTKNENSIAIHMDNYSWGNGSYKEELMNKNREIEKFII